MKKTILSIALASLFAAPAFALQAPDYTTATSAANVSSGSQSSLTINGTSSQGSYVTAGNQSQATEYAQHTYTVAPVYAQGPYFPIVIGHTTTDTGVVETGAGSTGGTTATSYNTITPNYYGFPIVNSGSVYTNASQSGSAYSTETIR